MSEEKLAYEQGYADAIRDHNPLKETPQERDARFSLDAASKSGAAASIEALNGMDGGHDNAMCHIGITTRAKCVQCRRVDGLRAASAKTKPADHTSIGLSTVVLPASPLDTARGLGKERQSMSTPTREEHRMRDALGNEHLEATESLSSVEIGESAKGEVSIKSVKVYHADPAEAARQALEVYHQLRAQMTEKIVAAFAVLPNGGGK